MNLQIDLIGERREEREKGGVSIGTLESCVDLWGLRV
jgi:hypothetical protein